MGKAAILRLGDEMTINTGEVIETSLNYLDFYGKEQKIEVTVIFDLEAAPRKAVLDLATEAIKAALSTKIDDGKCPPDLLNGEAVFDFSELMGELYDHRMMSKAGVWQETLIEDILENEDLMEEFLEICPELEIKEGSKEFSGFCRFIEIREGRGVYMELAGSDMYNQGGTVFLKGEQPTMFEFLMGFFPNTAK